LDIFQEKDKFFGGGIPNLRAVFKDWSNIGFESESPYSRFGRMNRAYKLEGSESGRFYNIVNVV
jgi:hypothetical protein